MKSPTQHKYRYILAGGVKPSDPISKYRLVGAPYLDSTDQAIRVIVDDVDLIKYSCDSYSTTNDTRTIAKLGYDCMVRINWKWELRNDLRPETENDMFMPYENMQAKGYQTAMRTYKGRKQNTYLDDAHAKEHYAELYRLGKIKARKKLEKCNGDILEMARRQCEITDEDLDDTDPIICID